MNRLISIKILGQPDEIRMGSPYNLCELSFSGTSINLPTGGWQDKYAWSENNKYLVLIHYDFEDNDPGFHFYIIDTETDKLKITERIGGFVNNLKIKENKIKYNKFSFNRVKSNSKELCCNTIEEHEIE